LSIQLTQTDFDALVNILDSFPDWRTEQGRIDLMDEVFAGSPRKRDVLNVGLSGTAHQAAVRVIQHLARFGQDAPGRETLWAFTARCCRSLGEGGEAAFLRGLPGRYASPEQVADPLTPAPTMPDSRTLYEVLIKHFNLEELHDLCFQRGIDYEEIKGDTKTTFARELVTYLERRGRLGELVEAVRQTRGNVI
jgi:hypothetical protein